MITYKAHTTKYYHQQSVCRWFAKLLQKYNTTITDWFLISLTLYRPIIIPCNQSSSASAAYFIIIQCSKPKTSNFSWLSSTCINNESNHRSRDILIQPRLIFIPIHLLYLKIHTTTSRISPWSLYPQIYQHTLRIWGLTHCTLIALAKNLTCRNNTSCSSWTMNLG